MSWLAERKICLILGTFSICFVQPVTFKQLFCCEYTVNTKLLLVYLATEGELKSEGISLQMLVLNMNSW